MKSRHEIYIEVLRGKVKPQLAKEQLMNIDENYQDLEIHVGPDDVISLLEKYLSNIAQAEFLNDWASFLLLEDVFVTPNWEDDIQADKYEPMWYVLQQLSCPALDGQVTHERAKDYVRELESLKKSIANF